MNEVFDVVSRLKRYQHQLYPCDPIRTHLAASTCSKLYTVLRFIPPGGFGRCNQTVAVPRRLGILLRTQFVRNVLKACDIVDGTFA